MVVHGRDNYAEREPVCPATHGGATSGVRSACARQYTLPYRDVVRAKIILMAADDVDNDESGNRLDTRREIVSKSGLPEFVGIFGHSTRHHS